MPTAIEMQYLSFTVDSALLRELGEKLVESVHLALVELVKNAYDADATVVDVIFSENDAGESEIRIVDDGVGMNFEDVQNYWMRIATTQKARQNSSFIYGRPRTGEKGIGRFSCRRLGEKLRLVTVGSKYGNLKGRQSPLERTEIEFLWDKFTPGTDVTKIKCPGNQSVVHDAKTGTTLIITMDETHASEWTTRGYNWLKRQLAVLAANRGTKRPGFQEDPGFVIRLIAPELEGGIRDLREDIINAGWGTLEAEINDEHRAVCKLNALGVGRKTITSQQTFEMLQDVSLRLGILIEGRGKLRDTGVLSLGTLKKILPEWGGLQVRYRGFRVYPYGDDDWLNIDRDRGLRRTTPKEQLFAFAQKLKGVEPGRALINMVSMRSYVGNVEIGSKARGFEMKASREGFIESAAVFQLKEFARFAIEWATIYYDFYLRNKLKEESDTARTEFEEVTQRKAAPEKVVDSAINYIQKEVSHLVRTLPSKERKQKEKAIVTATQAIRSRHESDKEELLHLRLIASTSTLLLVYSHEVKSLLGLLEQSKNSLQAIEQKLQAKDRDLVSDIRHSIEDTKIRFQDLLGLTALLGVDSKKAEPMQLEIRKRIERAARVFDLITKKFQIHIDYEEVPVDIVTHNLTEAELFAVLLNPISNSIKSVLAAGRDRKIQISASHENGHTLIRLRDSGVGIDRSIFEEVFEPFKADPEQNLYGPLEENLNPEDKHIVGTGSGLGLSIVREIVNARGGSVRFVEPKKGWNCELEISVS